jgi:hypothetical protein
MRTFFEKVVVLLGRFCIYLLGPLTAGARSLILLWRLRFAPEVLAMFIAAFTTAFSALSLLAGAVLLAGGDDSPNCQVLRAICIVCGALGLLMGSTLWWFAGRLERLEDAVRRLEGGSSATGSGRYRLAATSHAAASGRH